MIKVSRAARSGQFLSEKIEARYLLRAVFEAEHLLFG